MTILESPEMLRGELWNFLLTFEMFEGVLTLSIVHTLMVKRYL